MAGAPADEDVPETGVDPYLGLVVQGDIEIQALAGVGAMGKVYRAHQRGVDRDVAIKILHRELSGNQVLVQRFLREAKIASRLQHPHVVEVYLVGQLADGALYIVMEYLDGMSLGAATAAAGGTLPVERVIPIALQLCDAVGEAHARGIVHRDLKPDNVMLVRRADTSDWVKVLDFGIAKVTLGESSMATAAGLIFGTARYISPEGAQGATVGPPGDVYALATMLYQMLAGRTPFDAQDAVGLLMKAIHAEPPPLESWAGAQPVPAAVARVIMENLRKEPSERAANGRALGNLLNAAAREANVSFSDVGVVARMSLGGTPGKERATEQPSGPALIAQVAPVRVVTANTPISTRDAAAEALADTSADAPPPREIARAMPSAWPRERRRSVLWITVLTFFLGVAVTLLVTQQLTRSRDAEHAAHLARTRKALAAGNYVPPTEENVKDLVAAGLQRWPEDADLAQVKSDAAHELVSHAMASRSAGDLGRARELAHMALQFDPSDRAANILLDQYEDELRLADGGESGAPRVLIELPDRTRAGTSLELVAAVTIRGASPRAVNDARFTVLGPGHPATGTVLPASARQPGGYGVTFVPRRAGHYEIVFEASADGVPFRAERTLDVSR